MASYDQSYRTGEVKGQAEETMKDKAEGAKDKTYGTAQTARDKTNQTTKEAAHRTNQTKENTGSYLSGKARLAKEKTYDTTEAPKQRAAEAGKEKTGGVLQQTGEKVKNMAAGAADAVKSIFGMGEGNEDKNVGERKE